jgi:hypothetical protein
MAFISYFDIIHDFGVAAVDPGGCGMQKSRFGLIF